MVRMLSIAVDESCLVEVAMDERRLPAVCETRSDECSIGDDDRSKRIMLTLVVRQSPLTASAQ